MNRLALLATTALFPLAANAQLLPATQALAVPHGSTSGCPQGNQFVDGCPGAPIGTIQFPTLLSSYAKRAPWNVAGVDYYVGLPVGTVLSDPSTISVSGVTVNASAHTVVVSGSNITLSGIDFGLDNGWKATITGANDTIKNSRFTAGSNQGTGGFDGYVLALNGSGTTTITDNDINGNNVAVTAQSGALVSVAGSGALVIQYNHIRNAAGDMLEVGSTNATKFDVENNILENAGSTGTAHADVIQYFNSKIASGHIQFNTVYEHSPASINGEGILATYDEGSGETMSNMTERNNTLISLVNVNWGPGVFIENDVGTGTASTMTIHDNYFDPTGQTSSLWYGTGSVGFGTILPTPSAWYNLTNMKTGALIPVPSKSAPNPGFSAYVYPDANGVSPSLSSIYAFTPSPATGNITTGSTITIAVSMNEKTIVTGTPTLTLNSGGIATYASGSGTATLLFNYIVGSADTAATLAVVSVNLNAAPIPPSYILARDDEFPGVTLNSSNWTTGWFGSGITQPVNSFETACYGPTQVGVNNGLSLLAISSTNTCGGTSRPFLSGIITGTNFGAGPPWLQQYTPSAYFEAKITLPASGSSIANWPAFWLNSQNNPTTGEIDIMEGLNGQACFTFHNASGQQQVCPSGTYTGTHIFGAWWGTTSIGASRIDAYYDNKYIGSATSGITTSPVYPILNQAMSAPGNFGGPVVAPATMAASWFHVYTATGTPASPQAGYSGPGGGIATMKDDVGNPTVISPLTNLVTTFAGLSVNTGTPTLAFTTLNGGGLNTTTTGSGTYTGSAPSGLTNATYGGTCSGPSTVSGFSTQPTLLTWSATFTTPPTACTGTLTVTGTGLNTQTRTSPSATFNSTTTAFPGQPGNPVGYQAYGSGVLGTTPYPGGSFISGTSGSPHVYTGFVFTGGTNINCSFCNFVQCDFNAGTSTINVSGSNVSIYGSRFQSQVTTLQTVAVNNSGSNNLFSYDTMSPPFSLVPSPPGSTWPSAGSGSNSSTFMSGVNATPGADTYQIGIVQTGGATTIDHLDGWGFGQDCVEFRSTTAQMNFTNSWCHDAASPDSQGYHTDATGYMNGGVGPSNVLVQGNTLVTLGNSNAIAFQAATGGYANIRVIGNYVGGTGETIAMCSPGSTPCSGTSTFQDNVYGTDVKPVFLPIHGNNGAAWKCNTINFRAGTTWSAGITPTAANQGQFLLPNGTISPTDNGGNTVCP